MGAEQLRAARIQMEAKPKRRIIPGLDIAAKGLVRWFAENVMVTATVEFHPEFADDIVSATQDGLIQAYQGGPHTAWFDAIPMSYVSRVGIGIANEHLPQEEKIKGALMPFAKTMQTGKQGKLLDFMFQSTLPILTRNGVYPVYTSTDNDQNIRHEARNNEAYIADMKAMMKEGYAAIAGLPEGSVEAGRTDEDGNRKGMQELREGACASTILLAKSIRRPGVLFIPVGLEGGWKINNPQGILKKFPTRAGWKAGLLLTLDVRKPMDVCRIHVGKPIRSDSPEIQVLIKNRDWTGLDDMIGHAIADLVPEEMRGVYRARELAHAA